jgi:GntR family transcriptional regulator, N-acetylglucosamine utilization regulator
MLDRGSALPLYYQIQQFLLKEIDSGVLKPGEAISSEQEISARMKVSRMTVRQALKSLCSQGILYSQRGKGTFVSAIKLEKNFRNVLSFSEEMRKSGTRPSSTVLSFAVEQPDIKTAEGLQIRTDEWVISLRRLRMANEIPMAIEWTHLPVHLCPDLLETFDPHTSLYEKLAKHYGIHIAVTEEVAEAAVANAEESRLLQINKCSPVFHFVRTSYLRDGKPVEYVNSTYRGDRYRLVNRLTADSEKERLR